jgi:hypothetical protein
MNFKQNHNDIKNKLLKLENKRISEKTGKLKDTYHKGVYFISQYADDAMPAGTENAYKVGLARGASGLYQRVKSYAICYPYSDELWLHFMVICLSATDAEKFEKVVLADPDLHKIEKNPTKGSLEWRVNTRYHNIKDAIRMACIKHPDLWQKIIVFGENGWQVIHNDVSKKYTRSTFKLEKPNAEHPSRTNIYGTDEFIPVSKRGRKRKPVERHIKQIPLKQIPITPPSSNYKFARYTEGEPLAGRSILFKWDSTKPDQPRGWFKGVVAARKTTKREKEKGYNYNVKYTKENTQGEIVGTVATNLSRENYRKKWLLLRM